MIKNLLLNCFFDAEMKDDLLFLQSMDVFKNLTVWELKKFRNLIYKRKYIKNEKVFKQNQQAVLWCIVKSGKIELDNGNTKQILGQGKKFGKLFIFNDNEFYANTATAIEDSDVYLVHNNDFEIFINKNYSIGFKIIKQSLIKLYEEKNG